MFKSFFNHLGQGRPNHLGVTTLWLSGAFLATSVCCPGQPPFPAIFPGARCPRESTTAGLGHNILINYILASHRFPARSWCRNVSPRGGHLSSVVSPYCGGQLSRAVAGVLAVSGAPVLVLCCPTAGSPPPGREATERKPVAPAHPTRPVIPSGNPPKVEIKMSKGWICVQ